MKMPSTPPTYDKLRSYRDEAVDATLCPWESPFRDKTPSPTIGSKTRNHHHRQKRPLEDCLSGHKSNRVALPDPKLYSSSVITQRSWFSPEHDKDTSQPTQVVPPVQIPRPDNLLVNPCGKEGTKGWRQLNYNHSWTVEESPSVLNTAITTNFVSTHSWCSMEQTVDLSRGTANPSAARIEVSAHFMGHKDVPSVFRIQAEIFGEKGKSLKKMSTRILKAPSKFWEQAVLVLEPTVGAKTIKVTLHGKDSVLMLGHFGSKVTDCCVRVLGNEPRNDRPYII